MIEEGEGTKLREYRGTPYFRPERRPKEIKGIGERKNVFPSGRD